MRCCLSLLVLAIALAGCDAADTGSAVGDLTLSPNIDGLFLHTVDEYPCSNTPLVVATESTADRLTIRVEGVGEPSPCQRAFGPAVAFVAYPGGASLTPSAVPTYEVAIEKDGATDRFVFVCTFICSLVPVAEPEFTFVANPEASAR